MVPLYDGKLLGTNYKVSIVTHPSPGGPPLQRPTIALRWSLNLLKGLVVGYTLFEHAGLLIQNRKGHDPVFCLYMCRNHMLLALRVCLCTVSIRLELELSTKLSLLSKRLKNSSSAYFFPVQCQKKQSHPTHFQNKM